MTNEHPLKGTQDAVSGAQEQEVKRWGCDCEHFYAEWHADKITVVRASDYDALNLLRKSTAHAMELRAREVEALRERLREAQELLTEWCIEDHCPITQTRLWLADRAKERK